MTVGTRPRTKIRGMTLLELMVVLAIVVTIGGLSVMMLSRSKEQREHDASARELSGLARRARALATTGVRNLATTAGAPAPAPAPAPPAPPPAGPRGPPMRPQSIPPMAAMRAPASTAPVRYTGLRVVDTTTVQLFAVLQDGARVVVDTMNLATEYPSTNVAIVSPAPGTEIRFRKNGTRDMRFSGQIQLRNQTTNRLLTLDVNAGGLTSIK